jgi:DNA-binding HxlR family transcriptional regulator
MASRRAPDAAAVVEAGDGPQEWLPAHCAVAATLAMIGGKWKPSILYLLYRDATRFNALQRAMPGITQRMLTLQLRALERDGIVERTIEPTVPPQVEYALTAQGRSLGPLLEAICAWGTQHAGDGVRRN